MSLKRAFLTGGMLGLLIPGLVSPASAQVPPYRTVYFTFSESVTLPNVTLPAGKYIFRLQDPIGSNRSVIQVIDGDDAKSLGFFMTIPVSRPDRPEEAEIRFLETPADMAPAVASYWYPNDTTGWEFVYPREQARKLATATNRPVLTTRQGDTASTDEMRTADFVRVSPGGEDQPTGSSAMTAAGRSQRGEMVTDEPSASSTTARAADTASSSASAPASTTAAAARQNQSVGMAQENDPPVASTRTRLPATASYTPSVALAGLAALLTAVALRARRRRATF